MIVRERVVRTSSNITTNNISLAYHGPVMQHLPLYREKRWRRLTAISGMHEKPKCRSGLYVDMDSARERKETEVTLNLV